MAKCVECEKGNKQGCTGFAYDDKDHMVLCRTKSAAEIGYLGKLALMEINREVTRGPRQ